MDTSKHSQILAWAFAFISFVLWITETKWRDTKLSRLKRNILIICGILWGLGMVWLAVVSYKVITQHDKAPRLALSLHSLPLTNNACITIPTSNALMQLQFNVFNGGESEAENVQLFTRFSEPVNLPPYGTWPAGEWLDVFIVSAIQHINNRPPGIPDTPHLLPTNYTAEYPPIILQCSDLNNKVISSDLRVIAKNNVVSAITYKLHFTNGVGKAHSGL